MPPRRTSIPTRPGSNCPLNSQAFQSDAPALRPNYHIAPGTAITTIRTAAGHIALSAEADRAVATASSDGVKY